jgi:hypothetical protein
MQTLDIINSFIQLRVSRDSLAVQFGNTVVKLSRVRIKRNKTERLRNAWRPLIIISKPINTFFIVRLSANTALIIASD